MQSNFYLRPYLILVVAFVLSVPSLAGAQTAEISAHENTGLSTAETESFVTLSLDEAVQIALDQNYSLQESGLDIHTADAQVREAWGQVMPQVSASSSYQRNLQTPNPFAGSDAGGFFDSFVYLDWLAFNEGARTDGDPATSPISLDEFRQRQMRGYEDAGISFAGGDDNPFAVPNQFLAGISITQPLYNRSAFAAISGAERFRQITQDASERQAQVVTNQVTSTYYAALLAEERADVVARSVRRTARTVEETEKQLVQGLTSKYQRLSAEVELANLESDLIQAVNQADLARNNLKMVLGLPLNQPIRLDGSLEARLHTRYTTVSLRDAVELAIQNRPDLKQARTAIELREIDREITRSGHFPNVSAFADLSYIGNVPDNRTQVISDPGDPFSFSSRDRGFFSRSYWNPSVAVGVSLSWNLFNGFQTRSRVQQSQIEVQKSELTYEQLEQSVRLEVEEALRNLLTAERRIVSQEQNVQRAQVNYEFALARLREGVSSQLEERQASDLLDQSEINYLQAVHDYLVARSQFETSVGAGISGSDLIQLTSN